MPASDFFENASILLRSEQPPTFSDAIIKSLSNKYGVSREAIVRRLLTLDLVTKDFYLIKRNQYQIEVTNLPEKKKKGGPISPAKTIVSLAGRPYVSLVLGAIGENRITLNDASGYLNVRISQISKVGELVGMH
jgi:Zn-dependent peptidase ImmA (M78 family)